MQAITNATTQAKLRLERARAEHGLVDIAVSVFKRFSDDDGGFYAASLTYYMFFSIFPLLLFSASALGYLTFVSDSIREDLLRHGVDAVPLIRDFVDPDSINRLQRGRGTLALVGLVMALYAGSGGVVALEHALNRVFRIQQEPGFLARRIKSLKWLAALALAGILSVSLGVIARTAATIVGGGGALHVLVTIMVHALGAGLGVGIFLTAFKLLPAGDRSWADVLPGAVVAGIAFEVLKWAGGWYIAQGAETREATFGAFRTAAGLLVASYLLAQVTLLSAEVNAVLAERRQTRQSSPTPDGAVGPQTKEAS